MRDKRKFSVKETPVWGVCKAVGCDRQAKIRGFCDSDYIAARKAGLGLRPKASCAEKLEENVDKSAGPGGCWPWRAALNNDGYGKLTIDGKWCLAHRRAWIETHGPIPSGMLICHTCDNPPCCNDAHLFLGTDADNNADKIEKGRWGGALGERSPFAKLTDETVREARSLHADGTSLKALAKRYQVSDVAVANAVHRRTWRHVA